MNEAAENLDFEKAAILRDRIKAIYRSKKKKKLVNINVPVADIIGIVSSAENICVSVLMFRESRLCDKLTFMLDNGERDLESSTILD
jgi:excinuclease ABC subunit C